MRSMACRCAGRRLALDQSPAASPRTDAGLISTGDSGPPRPQVQPLPQVCFPVELLLFSSHSSFQILADFLKNKETKPKISSF